jgi:hypothetical protein
MKTSSLRVVGLSFLLCLVSFSARSDNARAAWPPNPGDGKTLEERRAFMKDPANWPNDPGYKDRWNYFSWLPEQKPGTPPYLEADKKLGASGMSVDVAWTYTVGRHDVRVAVIDSGGYWDNADLINQVWLNPGELTGTKKPQKANGDPCGGAGALAGYDCNGDGIFNILDYKDDPRFTGVVPGEKCYQDGDRQYKGDDSKRPDRQKGDLNRNCILDPGDLIEMFSDGVDDDGNGYVDDIAGWDFLKNDNNPYDDTRYGHGNGEASDATQEGNNGQGSIGVCPGCGMTWLRYGDSYVGDTNDMAKAVVYAVDNGFKVILAGVGPISTSAALRAAVDYAYSKNVVFVSSMADENQRHPNAQSWINHVINAHSIRYNASDVDGASSFLTYDPCSNYGGQLMLSVSATACSSEAAGRAAGLAGLVASYGVQLGLDLTAEETMQIMKMTADDIDVPESRVKPEEGVNPFYWSQPGWDQRFGYGRPNAGRMMQVMKDRLIPPEVDITSPEFFDNFYADRSPGQVPIRGRIAAKRAQAYDYKIEWAPGIQPEEKDYRPLVAELKNVPGTTVSGGGDEPIATFDPRQIDTKHERDPDSPRGENDRVITIRVRATAHYPNGDAFGEARRTVFVYNEKNGGDPDLLPGFPIHLGASIEASAKLADIDGDGVRDIVVGSSDGVMHVFTMKSGTPQEAEGFPYKTALTDGLNPQISDPNVPSYLAGAAYTKGANGGVDPTLNREAILTAAAIEDLDGDGKPEIVFVTWPGTIYVVNNKGKDLPGWPKRMPLVPSCPLDPKKPAADPCMDVRHALSRGIFGAPVIKDMDKDGKPEIIIASFDARIYVFKLDGSVLDGFPVVLHNPIAEKINHILATPTVADFNGDGIPDILCSSNEEIGGGGNVGQVFLVDGRGTKTPGGNAYFTNWPVTMTSLHLFPLVGEGIPTSQASADFDGDGKPDALIQSTGAVLITPADPGPKARFTDDPPNRLPVREDGRGIEPTAIFGDKTTAFQPDTMLPILTTPSIGDLDQDGVPDAVLSGGSLSFAGNLAGGFIAKPFQALLAMWSGKTGKMFPGSPVVMEDIGFFVNHAIADVNDDGYPEVITTSSTYHIRAVDACGREAPGFPKSTGGWNTGSPAVGNIDGTHALDVVATSRQGYIFAWRTKGKDTGVVQWESFHHDNANTGDYSVKLSQGVLKRASSVIDCSTPVPPVPETYDAGGCGACRTSSAQGGGEGALLVALGGLGLALARRRSRRDSISAR